MTEHMAEGFKLDLSDFDLDTYDDVLSVATSVSASPISTHTMTVIDDPEEEAREGWAVYSSEGCRDVVVEMDHRGYMRYQMDSVSLFRKLGLDRARLYYDGAIYKLTGRWVPLEQAVAKLLNLCEGHRYGSSVDFLVSCLGKISTGEKAQEHTVMWMIPATAENPNAVEIGIDALRANDKFGSVKVLKYDKETTKFKPPPLKPIDKEWTEVDEKYLGQNPIQFKRAPRRPSSMMAFGAPLHVAQSTYLEEL